jgi:hypothetical protein
VARLLRIHPGSVRRLRKRGLLRAIKLGWTCKQLFLWEDVQKMLRERRESQPEKKNGMKTKTTGDPRSPKNSGGPRRGKLTDLGVGTREKKRMVALNT